MSIIFNDNYKGVPLSQAVATVASITLSDNHIDMNFSVRYTTSDSVEPYNLEFYNFTYNSNAGDIVEQAYKVLRSLPKFN